VLFIRTPAPSNDRGAVGYGAEWGLDLPRSVRAVAMSLSTIIVAANAQLRRRLEPQRAAL
jgi:hypothetical protein